MKKMILLVTGFVCTTCVFAQVKKPAAAATKPSTTKPAATVYKNVIDSASYAIGVSFAQNIKKQGFPDANLALLQKGIADAFQNKPLAMDDKGLNECIGRLQQKVTAEQQKAAAEKAAKAKIVADGFLASNGKRPGVVTLPSGLQYEILKAGTDNAKPTLANTVKCHYHGTLIDGTVFDSSVQRGEPASFILGNVILGWQEALQLMTVGSKWKLFIPSNLAYGDNPPPGSPITPGAPLIFEVELLGIEK